MSIEYQQDWNTRLGYCGCCPMPLCPPPTILCEKKSVSFPACGHFFSNLFGAASMEPWMPNDPAFMTCEQKCVRYKIAEVTIKNTVSANNGSGSTYELSIDHVYTKEYEFVGEDSDPRLCESEVIASGGGSSTEEIPFVADNQWIKQEITYTLNPDGTATGTVTDTYQDPAYNETYPFGPIPFSEVFYPTDSWDNDLLEANSSGTEPFEIFGEEVDLDWELEVRYAEPIAVATMGTEATAQLALLDWALGACGASRSISRGFCLPDDSDPSDSVVPVPEEIPDCVQGIAETVFRYKLCVPPEHEGTYFRAEWDEVFYPEGWDDSTDPTPPAPVVTPKSWTWTGVAGGANNSDSNPSNDSEDRCSEWGLEVKVPAGEEGITVIRNMRTSCYSSSPYGTKYTLHESFGIYVEP